MATLLLTAVGTAFGGPLGGAIGGLIGRQVDQTVFGSGSREGPRLKELSVTTSSYGQAIPRVFGRMRVGGTVIWSTDLVETSQKEGGGKGKPSTTTYSYSASFAVALSSRPISRVGRIWADGNLLRGDNEDLKVEGTMRTYLGNGSDPVDPLIAADKGGTAPAFRDCAYVVFEDLQLGDFGNRIPALTFEVLAQNDARVSLGEFVPQSLHGGSDLILEHALGFSDEGGALASSLSAIDRVYPLTCAVRDGGLSLSSRTSIPGQIPILPRQLSQRDSSDASDRHKQRGDEAVRAPVALRYYDEQRDYQPGVQRANGPKNLGREMMIDLPATMTAAGAKQLANSNAQRSRWRRELVTWRIGELDPQIGPGSVVRLPNVPGKWLVKSWEWFDRGIELGLERLSPQIGATAGSDAGLINPPLDLPAPVTQLSAIEVPPDSGSDPNVPLLFAAASAATSIWKGASLFVELGDTLQPIGATSSRRTIKGYLTQPLSPSNGLLFEPTATLEVTIAAVDLGFGNSDLLGIANGANRLCVAGEVLQFLAAEEVSAGNWRLTGLLRGRGGTEDAALAGHPTGTSVTLLDDRLTALDPQQVPSDPATRIAAIGRGDPQPVYAQLQNAGLSRRPPSPVRSSVSSMAAI